jgi:hypothetical protein
MFPQLKALAAPVAALAACSSTAFADEGIDFFEKKVRPVLEQRCLECHSTAKKIKGGLRLDLREGWEKGGDAGPAIIPGDLEKSLVVEAIRYGNQDLQMPPKKKMADVEREVLEQWIKMGAPDPRTGESRTKKQTGLSIEEGRKFWSYQPVKQTGLPAVRDTEWPRLELDRFVLANIEAAGLRPAADAPSEVLARRVYYNLIGLPPTEEQLEAFKKEAGHDRQRALVKLVDELLASPRFCETWGRHWLDVARFAESSGGGRTLLFKDAWRYRDYVIEAINADMPFDRFIREQIAGDLLPAEDWKARRRQLTATAFLALGPTNYEEQEKQQLRFDVIDEQLETLGRVFLGQTIGCARCHDHKFDPIPQKDYYAMAGIFSSTRTLLNYTDNVARWIATPLPGDEATEAALRAHEEKVAALRKEIDEAKASLTKAAKAVSEPTTKPGMPIAKSELPGIILDDTDARVVGEWKHSKFVRSFIGEGYLHDDNTGKGEKTITFTPTIPESGAYEVRLAYAHANARANNIRVTVFHADGEDAVFVDQSETPPIEGRFVSLGKFRFEKDGAGYVLISNDGTKGYVTVDALQLIPQGSDVAKTKAPDAKSDIARHVEKLEADLKKLVKEGPVRETAMAVREDDKIEDTRIRVRGVEKQRGDLVPRGFMQVALMSSQPPLPANESGRREFADWIASPENPMTARVIVNRVWAWLIGEGIVRTVDNFGTTGEKPSNPELLDYLAARFIKQGWSVKGLVREIVLSRTWQLAVSKPSAQDPENALFAHANRRRLDADQIRDTLLSVSGRLNFDYLGPNIAKSGEVNANDFSAQDVEYGYQFVDTRRSVYTPAFRNKRLELFEVFDFADINQPIGKRTVSTVAPQALYLLNHPFVLEQARAAAKRLEDVESTEGKIVAAFKRTLGRAPTPVELQKSLAFITSAPEPVAEAWVQFQHMLFACVDFRYLE